MTAAPSDRVFAEEQVRLLSPPLHAFSTDRIEAVSSRKTIYVRFDLNDYSIPPEAVGRPLILAASDTTVRILDGTAEIARHPRSYDRAQMVLDRCMRRRFSNSSAKATHATPASRLEQLIPESRELLDAAFALGESAGRQIAQLTRLLDEFGLRRCAAASLKHCGTTRPAPRP